MGPACAGTTRCYSAASLFAAFALRGFLGAADAVFADAVFADAVFADAVLAVLRGARRLVEPVPRAARASMSATASSSVMVSGVLSDGRVALTPSWLT